MYLTRSRHAKYVRLCLPSPWSLDLCINRLYICIFVVLCCFNLLNICVLQVSDDVIIDCQPVLSYNCVTMSAVTKEKKSKIRLPAFLLPSRKESKESKTAPVSITVSYHIISYHIIFYHIIYHIISFNALLCYLMCYQRQRLLLLYCMY